MEELTQTVAVLYCLASAQMDEIWSKVALGARRVWSMRAETSVSVVGRVGVGLIGGSASRLEGREARRDSMPFARVSWVTDAVDMVSMLCDDIGGGVVAMVLLNKKERDCRRRLG